MNQTVTPVTPVRTSGPADSPEIKFVVRHYLWLIILGPMLGAMIGFGSWYLLRKYYPRYTVYANFQVLPERLSTIDTNNATLPPQLPAEEITRFIRRQQMVITNDALLEKALQHDAFQVDYKTPGLKSRWIREYGGQAKINLRKQLLIIPVPSSDVFQIGLSGPDPKELADQVNAIAETYTAELRNSDAMQATQKVRDVGAAKEKLDESIKLAITQLEEFRQTHDIQAITQAYQVNTQTLGQLTAELIKAESEIEAAKTQLEIVKRQVADNSLRLSPEMQQFVESDPNLRYLEQTRLSLEQERAVLLKSVEASHKLVQAIDARRDEVIRQIDDVRQKLESQARVRMQENAENFKRAAEAQEANLRDRRDRKDRELKDLDRWLVEYKNRQQTLDTQQKLQEELNRKYMLLSLQSPTDSGRVRSMGKATPPEPSDISFPSFKWFMAMGPILGLAFSGLLAYLLELTNTRVRTPRDITRTIQLPLLGFVPDQNDDDFVNGDLATSIRTSPASMIAESFRQIRGRLAAQTSDSHPLSTLLVASASPGGGATTVASNLANAIALNDLRVLLIDANFYRPGLRAAYKNIPAVGLGDVLADMTVLKDAVVPSTDLPSLHLMGAGSQQATRASELLESRNFRDMLAQLKARYDLIIFDGAPLNLVGDSLSLASKLDGVIAVVRAGVISRGTVIRVRDQLKQVKAQLVGIVLNAAQTRGSGYFKQNYRIFYEYASTPAGRSNSLTVPSPVN